MLSLQDYAVALFCLRIVWHNYWKFIPYTHKQRFLAAMLETQQLTWLDGVIEQLRKDWPADAVVDLLKSWLSGSDLRVETLDRVDESAKAIAAVSPFSCSYWSKALGCWVQCTPSSKRIKTFTKPVGRQVVVSGPVAFAPGFGAAGAQVFGSARVPGWKMPFAAQAFGAAAFAAKAGEPSASTHEPIFGAAIVPGQVWDTWCCAYCGHQNPNIHVICEICFNE